MNRAIVIGRMHVRDQAKMHSYKVEVAQTLARFDAQVIVRAHQDDGAVDAVVVIGFPDLATAHQWHRSPQYQALVPLRNQAASVTFEFFEEAP
jgi:uncharacterized protein (DUF1330 family)